MSAPLPDNPSRIVLVNPTRYLGNLLIAGALIQEFVRYCESHHIEFKLVVDAAFAELLDGAVPDKCLLLYPRRRIKQAGAIGKLVEYWRCLREIRQFKADIAFNIEEDSVSHRLTQLSGARFRIGCSKLRHQRGYEVVVPIDFTHRPAHEQHRWYGFQRMFAALGMHATQPRYLQILPRPLSPTLQDKLTSAGVDLSLQQVVLHAGATKDYKKWPLKNFAALCESLRAPDRQVVFIGAGADAAEIDGVLKLVPAPQTGIVNLCNKLALAELAHYFRHVKAIVGNDSGPFHLAAAQGVAGLVIFGPTDVSLWGPLSAKAMVMKSAEPCAAGCTRQHCVVQHRCLTSVTPEHVLAQLQPMLS